MAGDRAGAEAAPGSVCAQRAFVNKIVTIQSGFLSKAKNNLMGIAPESLRKGGKSRDVMFSSGL